MIRITSSPEIYATAIGLYVVVSCLDNKPFIYSMEHGDKSGKLLAAHIVVYSTMWATNLNSYPVKVDEKGNILVNLGKSTKYKQ